MMSISQIKQIAGRAGRFRSARLASKIANQDGELNNDHHSKLSSARESADAKDSPSHRLTRSQEEDVSENVGLVTSLHDPDLPHIQSALLSEDDPIITAGLEAPTHVVQRFASYFPPGIPFSYIIHRLKSQSMVHPRYFLSTSKEADTIADSIEDIKGLDTLDRYIFSAAPVGVRDRGMLDVLRAVARCVAGQSSGSLLEIKEIPLEILDEKLSGDKEYIHRLELLHKSLILYLWLSYRFGGIFIDRAMASHVKELVEEKIDRSLTEFSANKRWTRLQYYHSKERLVRRLMMQEALAQDLGSLDAAEQEGTKPEVPSGPVDTPALSVDWARGAENSSIESPGEGIGADEARLERPDS